MINVGSKGDYLVILIAIILIGSSYVWTWSEKSTGDRARIFISGKPWKTVSLGENRQIQVPGRLGSSQLIIADHKIRFSQSPCNGKLCIVQGWLSRGGEVAVCLPNRVSIEILGGKRHYDTINF